MAFGPAEMQQMGQMIAQLMAEKTRNLVEQLMKTKGGKIDTKSIGGAPEWDSMKEEGFQEWNIQIKAWLVNQDPRALGWLKTATGVEETVETKDYDTQEFADDMTRMDCKKLKGEAFNIVSGVHDGCGLEAWRLLRKRYEPRTPATKRALLKTIFNMKAAKKVEEIEKNFLEFEDIFTRYETMANKKVPEDIKTVIMMELCTPDLKENLEFNLKDVGYEETREAVMAYVERKRIDPITAMEIGNHENDHYENAGGWWGGDVNEDNYGDNEENYHQEVNYSGYGSKGYGLKGKGYNCLAKGKGKSVGKGGGGGKTDGFNEGGGKGKGGKGKGGQKGEFQGTCHWCGKWGHTASRCSDKGAYMECVRGGNGPANHSQETAKETYNLQNEDEEGWSRWTRPPLCERLQPARRLPQELPQAAEPG